MIVHLRLQDSPCFDGGLALRVPRKLLMATNPVNLEVSKDSKRKPASALRCGVCGPRLGPFL